MIKRNFFVRIVCFILTVCIYHAATVPCLNVQADDTEKSVVDSKAELLYELSVIDDKSITDERITIDETAALLLRLREPGKETRDAAADAIRNGLIDNTFYGGITLEKFTESVLNVLYYEQYLSVTGVDKMQLAKRLGLFDGINTGNPKSALSKDTAVKMAYNALFAPPCKFGEIEIAKDTTYMEDILKIYEVWGVLTANNETSLYSEVGLIDSLKIGDTVYNGIEYGNYLGYSVRAYVDSDNNILYVCPTEKNNEISIDSENLDNINGNAVKYWLSNNKTKTVNVKNGAPVIYNDCYLGPWGADAVNQKITSGYDYIDYVLLDNDSDKVFDVVFMKKYDSLYITGVHMSGEILGKYDELHQKWVYFVDGDKFIMPDGSTASFENVSDRTVLSFSEKDEDVNALLSGSTDRDPMVFYICDSYISGLAGSVTSKSGRDYLEVDGEAFELNREYGMTYDVLRADNITGQDITAYSDINGRIVYYELNTGVVYVCIVGMDYDDLDRKGRIKLFNTANKMEIREISKNIKIYDPNSAGALVNKNGAAANKVVGIELLQKNLPALQKGIVKVKYNSRDELISINLPRQLAYGERGVDNEFNCVKYEARNAAGETGYEKRYGILNDMYIMLGSTAAGVTTQFLKPYGGSDEDWKCVRSTGNSISQYDDVDLYNIDADFCFDMTYSASATLEQDGMREVSPAILPSVVKNVGEVLMDDGNVGLFAEVFYDGKLVEYKTSHTDLESHENAGVEKKLLTELEFGDIVQFDISGDEIIGFRILLDYSEGKYGRYKLSDPYTGGVDVDSSTSHYINAGYRMGYGKIESHGTDYIGLNVKGLTRNFWRSRFRKAVLVDMEAETIEALSHMHMTENPHSMFYKFDWGPDQIMVVYQ